MKGTGQRIWDLSSSEDEFIDVLLDDPDAAEIMDVDMRNRLGPYVEVDGVD